MKIIILLTLFYLFSCNYPDVDTVPTFENIELSKDELFDLCQLLSNDNSEIDNCIKEKQTNE